jgi:hypothetical protein
MPHRHPTDDRPAPDRAATTAHDTRSVGADLTDVRRRAARRATQHYDEVVRRFVADQAAWWPAKGEAG